VERWILVNGGYLLRLPIFSKQKPAIDVLIEFARHLH
jgi:hypothetical protein